MARQFFDRMAANATMRNVKTKQLVKSANTRKPLLLGRRAPGSRSFSGRLAPAAGTPPHHHAPLAAPARRAPGHAAGHVPVSDPALGGVEASLAPIVSRSGVDLNERVKELL